MHERKTADCLPHSYRYLLHLYFRDKIKIVSEEDKENQ